MSYQILRMPQHVDGRANPEWIAARLGRLTASVAGDMLATVAKGEAASRRNLRLRLVLERLTNQPQERVFVSPAMVEGTRREDEARGQYEALTGELVENTGFISHDLHMVGCSLDGCVFDGERIAKIVELKNPEPAAHLAVIRTGQLSAAYMAQILHALWVTGADSCDWMSYHPAFPEGKRTKLITVKRDPVAIADYEAKALAFLAEVDAELLEIERVA